MKRYMLFGCDDVEGCKNGIHNLIGFFNNYDEIADYFMGLRWEFEEYNMMDLETGIAYDLVFMEENKRKYEFVEVKHFDYIEMPDLEYNCK